MLSVGDFQSMTFTGTLYYFSPEMYHQGKATFTTDIWLVNHLLRLIYNLANHRLILIGVWDALYMS